MPNPASIHEQFVVMSPDKRATVEPCDAELYSRLEADYDGFSGHELVSCHTFSADWSSWEMHPRGDEVVMLMSGRTTFILDTDDGEVSVDLSRPGQYVIVPKGVWHTASTPQEATVLFITPGEGTQHAERSR